MQLKKKGKKKKVIIVSIIVLVLAVAGTVFFVLQPSAMDKALQEKNAEALSVTASTGDIATTVVGTGTLAADTANDVKVPTGIKIREVMVESGDKVKEGDVLATLDEASLAEALADAQEQIAEIDEEINDAKEDTQSSYIKTYVSGRIKKIYVKEEVAVNTTMGESGALMLLSIGGKMAVKIEIDGDVMVDDTVTVTLSDGETLEGTVASVSGTSCVVTMTDNGPEYEESVVVSNEEGTVIGDGQLYIYQQLEITGIGGTVNDIYVSENQSVSAEKSLIKLTDVPTTAEYQKLIAQRSQLIEELQLLTNLAATNAITATCSGTIQSIGVSDDTTVEKSGSSSDNSGSSSSSGNGMLTSSASLEKQTVFTFTSAASAETVPAAGSTVTQITDFAAEIISNLAIVEPVKDAVADTSNIIYDQSKYTADITWYDGSGPLASGAVFQAGTQYTVVVKLHADTDNYAFAVQKDLEEAYGATGTAVVEVSSESILQVRITFRTLAEEETDPETETDETKGPDETKQPETEDKTKQTETTQDKTGTAVAGSSTGNSAGTGSTSGSASSGGTVATESSSDTSSSTEVETNYVTAFTISTDETMVLAVNIDELDILTVQKGQQATVTLDALEGESFDGEITHISDAASASGGVTKYSVEVTIAKTESMLAGMNASATITVESKENVITLPADAVWERGNRQYVYTEQDGDSNMLSGEVEVETGISDGTNVEIVSGLTEGQTVYYNKVISESSSEEDAFMMGVMPNGENPLGADSEKWRSGERPSGGPGQ